ncbi:MAG TPA: hypothetical protein VGJ20_04715 [Xanthobacteraceae bacterium]
MKRVAQVHYHGAPCNVVIGEQKTALGHPVLGVMHLLGLDAGGARGDQMTVVGRSGIAINDGDEVFAYPSRIARPGK